MVVVIQWMIFYSKLLPSHCFELHWNAPGSFSFPLSMCSENHCSMHLIMKSSILGSQHSCSWISFEGWQNPDQCPWFWSLTKLWNFLVPLLWCHCQKSWQSSCKSLFLSSQTPSWCICSQLCGKALKQNFTLRIGKRHGRGKGGVGFS